MIEPTEPTESEEEAVEQAILGAMDEDARKRITGFISSIALARAAIQAINEYRATDAPPRKEDDQ